VAAAGAQAAECLYGKYKSNNGADINKQRMWLGRQTSRWLSGLQRSRCVFNCRHTMSVAGGSRDRGIWESEWL